MKNFDLDPQSWVQLRDLLQTGMDLPPDQRERWLNSLGADVDALKPRLRSLLAHATDDDADDGLLSTRPNIVTAPHRASKPNDQIGPYRLIKLLGEGGMGSVWLAERDDLMSSRQVALKLPHALSSAGQRDSLAEWLARERDILARLTHPHIARLYDAGISAQGQPYLALEYVEGARIDAYSKRHALNTRARLQLLQQVARAVAYAHANLIVHRDLKPSNILVTDAGEVRLLDFGIAKLLVDGVALETELTREAGRRLTLQYAAPEQVNGGAVGIAADVYALGVILYELLCGESPYQLPRNTRAALEEAITDADTAPPSLRVQDLKLRKQLRGDLDTVVLKALKKSPSERYRTADELADDIQRYLSNQPVLAQPDRALYRARKFIARNRFVVAASALVFASLTIGAGVAFWQASVATAQRDAALQQQQRAEAFSDFMRLLLQDAGNGDRALTPTQLLNRGVQMLEQQTALDDSVTGYLWYELSRNYLLFRHIDHEVELLDRSAAAAQRIGDMNLLAASHCAAAWSLLQRDRAVGQTRLTLGTEALAASLAPATYAMRDCLRAESQLLRANGQIADAIDLIERALPSIGGLGARSDDHDVLLTQLSDLYRASDRFKDALVLAERTLRITRESGRTGSLAEFVQINNVAGNLCNLGEFLACATMREPVLKWVESADMVGLAPTSFRTNASLEYQRLGDPQRALDLVDTDRDALRATGQVVQLAIGGVLAARALLDLHRPDDALRRLEESESVWRLNPAANARMFQESDLTRADIAFRGGDAEGARAMLQVLLTRIGYPQSRHAPGLDRVLRLAGRVELHHGDATAAERLAADALTLSLLIARTETSSADVGWDSLLLAQALHAQRHRQQALIAAERAANALRSGVGAQHADVLAAEALVQQLRVAR